jgi:hypothetical protein
MDSHRDKKQTAFLDTPPAESERSRRRPLNYPRGTSALIRFASSNSAFRSKGCHSGVGLTIPGKAR